MVSALADARHRVATTEHGLLDIVGQHRAVAAQVFPDRLDLLRHPHQELQVGVQVGGPTGERRLLPLLVALADEVVDEDLPLAVGGEEALLPVAVDAPVALLQPVRVPRNFVVDEPGAVVLEVQAFGGGVGGKQDAHRADFGSRLESSFDIFPLLHVHAAVHGQQPVVIGEALLGEDFLEPVLRGPVLGEDDDPLVAPFLAGANVRVEPVDQALHLRVELARRLFRPLPHLLQQGQFLFRRLAEQQRGGVHGVGRRLVVLGVVGVVLVDPVEFLLQDANRRLADGLATLGLPE